MMYLADTSIWIDFLAFKYPILSNYLNKGEIYMHPYVVAEVALGSLSDRKGILSFMNGLPLIEMATHEEIMSLIEVQGLYSQGLGYVDTHLLASAMLTPQTLLWTKDKRLLKLATDYGIGVDFMG